MSIDMPRVQGIDLLELVVANQTIGSKQLHDHLVARARSIGARFHLLVPATPLARQEEAFVATERLARWPGEDPGFALARMRLDRALRTLRTAGVQVEGSVGPPDPLDAVRSHLLQGGVQRILVCTLPRGRSRWLRRGLPTEISRATGVAVEHLEVGPG
jgi:hypothetical protein